MPDHQPPPTVSLSALLAGGPSSVEQSAALWRMSAAERVSAMRRGALSLAQLTEWSSTRPHEVPLIGGEFEYIARFDPDYLGVDG